MIHRCRVAATLIIAMILVVFSLAISGPTSFAQSGTSPNPRVLSDPYVSPPVSPANTNDIPPASRPSTPSGMTTIITADCCPATSWAIRLLPLALPTISCRWI